MNLQPLLFTILKLGPVPGLNELFASICHSNFLLKQFSKLIFFNIWKTGNFFLCF